MENELIRNILNLSVAKTWEEAKKEWKVDNVFINPKYQTCLCSHYPIKEVIVLQNQLNTNVAEIGNCCINRFFENKDYNKFFKALAQNRINKLVITLAYDKGVINDWEQNFLIKTWRKKVLTEKQSYLFQQLKEKILLVLKTNEVEVKE